MKVHCETRKPIWLKVKASFDEDYRRMKKLLSQSELHTVCQEASCPNIGQCFSQKTATFMILGRICTRSCSFCDVEKGIPRELDPDEPQRLAEMVEELGLKYVVVTSVTRDDLKDGGASHFAASITEIKKTNPRTKIEVLIPDFGGSFEALKIVMESQPRVLNHNLETVERLYPEVRPEAVYHRSLELLYNAKKISRKIVTKSGLMIGLGENWNEIIQAMKDLRKVGCDLLTIGQYLRSDIKLLPVTEYIHPEKFDFYAQQAREMGFLEVASGPFVRSSYNARESFINTLTAS